MNNRLVDVQMMTPELREEDEEARPGEEAELLALTRGLSLRISWRRGLPRVNTKAKVLRKLRRARMRDWER